MKFLGKIVAIILIFLGVAWGYPQVKSRWFAPACSKPITYSIGDFSSQFKISQSDFQSDVEAATQIWEKSVNKDLFTLVPNGGMKINLVYDSRQQATDRLKSLGIKIESTQSSYNQLKVRYDTETESYNIKKEDLEPLVEKYQTAKQAYESQVRYWNSQGGAPQSQYKTLQNMQTQLNAQAAEIKRKQDDLNKLIDDVNAVANVLNHLAQELNINVSSYNTIGQSQGSEFEEGVYIKDTNDKHIDIYEFNDQQQLIRLLAHELGHSLGMEHVDDPDAIMYRLNQGSNAEPTTADLVELSRVCKIQ